MKHCHTAWIYLSFHELWNDTTILDMVQKFACCVPDINLFIGRKSPLSIHNKTMPQYVDRKSAYLVHIRIRLGAKRSWIDGNQQRWILTTIIRNYSTLMKLKHFNVLNQIFFELVVINMRILGTPKFSSSASSKSCSRFSSSVLL